MSDDKRNTGKQDDIRIDRNDPSEVEYLHQQFPNKSHEEIVRAIEQKGPMREDVVNYLRGR